MINMFQAQPCIVGFMIIYSFTNEKHNRKTDLGGETGNIYKRKMIEITKCKLFHYFVLHLTIIYLEIITGGRGGEGGIQVMLYSVFSKCSTTS